MERRMKSRIACGLLAGFALAVISCPNPLMDKDLRAQVASDVSIATAAERHLTVEGSANGVVTPSGVVTVKDGIGVAVSATAFPAYGVIGWRQTGGPGRVTFEQTPAGINATVNGGDAAIAAILVEKPKVLYSTPIGNNIARSATITATFSRQVDFDTINLHSFRVLRNGNEQITTGRFSVSADGKTVKFDPDDPLGQFCNYVITVAPDVKGILDLASYQVGNTLVTDAALLLAAEYTAAFRTNADVDNNPPDPGDFTVTGTGGALPDPFYTGSDKVRLTGITANDDSGVISAYYVKNESSSTYQAFPYDYQDPSLSWTVPLSPGRQGIMMYFEDPNGNANSGSPTTKYIVVDTQPPTGTMTVNGLGPGGDYVPAGPATLAVTAADPDIGALKGSGESTDGSVVTNRKLMRFANDVNGLADAPWETYAATRNGWGLAHTAEGWNTVWAQFADAVGNVSSLISDQVYLDSTPPGGSFQMPNGLFTNTEAVALAIAASDAGSGLNRLQVDTSPGLATNSAWSTSTPESGTLTGTASSEFTWPIDGRLNVVLAAGEGSRTVNLKVKDKVGNVGSLTRTLTLDKTPPTGGAIAINGGAVQTNNANVTINVVASPSDVYSPISAMAFSNTPSPVPSTWIPYGSGASWSLDPSGGGTKTVYAWFKDAAGNSSVSPNTSDDITLDVSPPSGTISLSPNPTTGTVTIYCNSADAATMRFSNNSAAWSGWEPYATTRASWSLVTGAGGSAANGARAVYAQYRDAALNISATTAATVTLDSTAPTATISIASGAAWTTSGTVTLNLTASDAIYGPGSLQMQFSNDNNNWSAWEPFASSRSWSLVSGYGGTPANGTKPVYVKVRDPLLNTSASYSDTIGYDSVVPVAGILSVNTGATYATSQFVTLMLTSGGDSTSGVYQMRFSNNATLWSAWEPFATNRPGWDMTSPSYGGTTANGTRTVYAQVRDNAGLVSTTVSDSIIFDTVPPSGGFTIESGNPATSVYTGSVLYFSISDATTGVVQRRMSNDNVTWSPWEPYTATTRWYLLPRNGFKTVFAQFKDGAGNLSTTFTDQVTLAAMFDTLGGQDLWGAYSTSVSPQAAYAYMTSNPLDFPGSFTIGSVLVFFTQEGHYGKLEVVDFQPSVMRGLFEIHENVLTFHYCVYTSDGVNLIRQGTGQVDSNYDSYFDFEYGVPSQAGADFAWRPSGSYAALVPSYGALFAEWR